MKWQLLLHLVFYRWWMRLLIVFTSALSTVALIASLFFQKNFIDVLTEQKFSITAQLLEHWPNMATWMPGNLYALLFFSFFSLLTGFALSQIVYYWGTLESLHMQKNFSQRLYAQTLSLRSDTLGGRPLGEIVSVYTTDVPGAAILLEQILPQFTTILFPLIAAPLALHWLVGPALKPGLFLIFGMVIVNFYLAYRQSQYFYRFKKLAADRIGLVNEWVQNVRALRILGWMDFFEEKIQAIRKVETKNRIAMLNNGQSMNALASSITFALNLFVLHGLIWTEGISVTPGSLLALLWIVGVFLTRPFRQMPWFFTFLFDGWTSLVRVADILEIKNVPDEPQNLNFQKVSDLANLSAAPATALEVKNLNLSIRGHNILNHVGFEVQKGELIAIVGSVGSGKTMLLLSLIGETGAQFENYSIGSNNALQLPREQLRQFFTFVPQEGFIMSSTLRDNVAFNYDIAKEKDLEIGLALSHAQFQWSTERLEQGLSTEIGERGVNLSGGQKQRVSIARVDYIKSPIVLLDDCLSALDVDTERKLVSDLFNKQWKGRTRILATHRLSILPLVNRVLFLESGHVLGYGPHEQLLKDLPAYHHFVRSLETAAPEASHD